MGRDVRRAIGVDNNLSQLTMPSLLDCRYQNEYPMNCRISRSLALVVAQFRSLAVVLACMLPVQGTVAQDAAKAQLVPSQPSETKPADAAGSELPLVFEEDFEKDINRWETTDDQAWDRRQVGKGFVFGLNRRKSDYEPEHRSPHNIALIRDIEVADFTLTFRVRSTKDTGGHRDCCIFFGYQDPSHFYYIHLGAKPDPHSGQIMIVDGAPRIALTDNQTEVAWDDDWHTVKVVRDSASGTIEVYFDDMKKPHMRVVNRKFGKGRIGLGSFDDMNDFDDIKLYGHE